MTTPNAQQIFRDSLNRCQKDDNFLDRFYQHFINSSEEVRNKFADTDLEAQKQRLLASLLLAADVVDGDAAAMRHLHRRAESHDRRHLDIRPALYDQWLEALLATAKECDRAFGSDTEQAWRSVLGHIIGYMQAHH